MRPCIIHGAALLLALTPGVVLADLVQFIPTPTHNGAFLTAEASHENELLGVVPQQSGWTDGFVREKLTVFSEGYVYHPRFLQYRLSLGGVLRQEKYEPFGAPPAPWKSDQGYEYNVRLLALPEHPYNGEVFAERFSPLFKERSSTEHDTVGTTRGAAVHYRRKPYFFDASAQHDGLEATTTHSDVTSYRLHGQFFKEYHEPGKILSLGFSATPTRYSGTAVDGETSEYTADGLFTRHPFGFTASAGRSSLDQSGTARTTVGSDQRFASGQVSLTLPAGFRTHVSYGDYRNEARVDQPLGPPESPVTSDNTTARADITHRLYQSLDTSYAVQRSDNTSSQGDNRLLSHTLTGTYNKNVPRGRIHVGGAGVWTNTKSHGQAAVVNEPHLAQSVPGSFTLEQTDIDPTSVSVFLKSPIAPFETILLTEHVHYVVMPVLNTLEIRMLTLPARFVVPGSYDFFAFYSLARATFELSSQTFGVTLGAELFDELFAPYASYADVSSQVLEGALPGPPLETTNKTIGVASRRGGLQLRVHYDTIDWDVSPSQAWAFEAQYGASVARTTRLSASANYQDRYFPRGSAPNAPQPISDQLAQASAGVQQQLFSRSLVLAGSGSFSRLMGRSVGNSWAVTGSLAWRVGKLTVDGGAAASWGESQADVGPRTSRSHQFYYVSLRRNLF